MLRTVFALFLVTALPSQKPAETSPSVRFARVAARLTADQAQLARWAMDNDLYREARSMAREVLLREPGHEIGKLTEELREVSSVQFRGRYPEAAKKLGNEFRKRKRKLHKDTAKELEALAVEATKAGDAAVADHSYRIAYRLNSASERLERSLKKLGYDVIFNYGALPKADKEAAGRSLRKLGGTFLRGKDLRKVLELWSDAWGLRTRHYRFVTNAPHTTVFAFAQACEDLHDAWELIMKTSGLKVRKLKEPAEIYFFDSPLTYQGVLLSLGQEPEDDLLGFYSPSEKIGFFLDDPEYYEGDLALLIETFNHEGTHQLLDLRVKSAWRGNIAKHDLTWVEEGFATYMESLVADGEGRSRRFTFGKEIDDDLGGGVDLLLADKLMPLQEFVHMDNDAWVEYDHGYQHAVLLTHFLLEGGDKERFRRAAFRLLLDELTMGGTRKQTLFEQLRASPDELASALAKHAENIDKALPRRQYESGEGK